MCVMCSAVFQTHTVSSCIHVNLVQFHSVLSVQRTRFGVGIYFVVVNKISIFIIICCCYKVNEFTMLSD